MSTGAAIPPRALLGLTAAVLAVHMLLLRGAPIRVQVREPARAAALATRTIESVRSPAPATPRRAREPTPVPAALLSPPQPAVTLQVRPAITMREPEVAPVEPVRQGSAPVPAATAAASDPALAARFAIPAPVRLRYQVNGQTRRQNWQGSGELLWRHDGDSYEARLEVSAPHLPGRVQHSTGRITAQGLAPLRFSDKGRSEQATHFEREADRVSFSNNRPAAALLPGAQDRLSVLVQLAAMLAAEPHRYSSGTSIAIQTASTREAEPWIFTVEHEEQLDLPGGAVTALKLSRPPRREFDQHIEVWLAPGQDYVPVRLRLTQPNGDWVDQQWSATDRR